MFSLFCLMVLASKAEAAYDCLKEKNKPSPIFTLSGGRLPEVGYGTDNVRSRAIFISALTAGYRFFDLAETYQNLGEFKAALIEVSSSIKREDLFINYKIPLDLDFSSDLSFEDFFRKVDHVIVELGGYMDTLMIHNSLGEANPNFLKKVLTKLNQEYLIPKKIRYLGFSNVSTKRKTETGKTVNELELLNQVCLMDQDLFPGVHFIENRFNPTFPDETIRAAAFDCHIKYIGYSIFGGQALGSGATCAQLKAMESDHFNVKDYLPALEAMRENYLVGGHKPTPYQLVLAWGRQMKAIQIPKASDEKHMRENLETLNLNLSDADLNIITNLSSYFKPSESDLKNLAEAKADGDVLLAEILPHLDSTQSWEDAKKLVQIAPVRGFFQDQIHFLKENRISPQPFWRNLFRRVPKSYGGPAEMNRFLRLFETYSETKASGKISELNLRALVTVVTLQLKDTLCSNGFYQRYEEAVSGDYHFVQSDIIPGMDLVIQAKYPTVLRDLTQFIYDSTRSLVTKKSDLQEPARVANESFSNYAKNLMATSDEPDAELMDIVMGDISLLLASEDGDKVLSTINRFIRRLGIQLTFSYDQEKKRGVYQYLPVSL